jgi:hypothetical protein
METEKLIQNILDGKQNIEVVENGKPVTNPRIDPAVMSFIMQASQLAQIVKIRKYFDDRTSHGLIQTYDVTVTDELKEIKVDFPAQSFSLINDGPDTVYVWVNTTERPKVTVKSGAKFEPNYETHKINYIYLQCASGESTDVRIVAKD